MRVIAVMMLVIAIAGCDRQRVRECPTLPVPFERTVPTRDPIPAKLIEPVAESWAWPAETWGEALDAANQCTIAFRRLAADREALRALDAEHGKPR